MHFPSEKNISLTVYFTGKLVYIQVSTEQRRYLTCSQLIPFCKDQLTGDLLRYWRVRAARSLYCGATKPKAGDTTQNPSGHQGILQCRLCVSSAVWWPGIKHQVEQQVRSCPACTQASLAHRQPMISYPLPNYPWEKVASDLFELHCKTYLLVADYFSRYLEVQTLTTTTSASVIRALIAIFSRHGIPAVLMSDNGPQYSSQEMKDFANQYNFKHVTSSPHYPQSNGMAKHMVKTAKSLLEKSADPYLVLYTRIQDHYTALVWNQSCTASNV